jgi:Carboxypeptidase regulatory-like domain
MRRAVQIACLALLSFLLVPVAYAQGTLSGVVKDASGAVMPGVAVEATSPVLIEKVRTAVTDGAGQYRIVDLRGGTYSVTFSITGFSTVKKDGVQLAGETIVTVNADMRLGAVAETITVTGEVPIVDVQSTTRQQVLTKDAINTLPSGRNYQSLGVMIPGVNTSAPDSGGAMGDTMAQLTIHGSRPGDQRVMQNGVNTMTLQVNGDRGIAVPNPGMASEVTIDTSGLSAEQSQGGVRINYIPRDGGNRFSGTTFVSFTNNSLQGNNLTDDLKARGLPTPNSIKVNYDINPGFGGPIQKDRIWFYFTGRVNRADNYAAGSFVNVNGFDPRKLAVVYDTAQPGYSRALWTDGQIRLTMQATPRNKIAFTWDQQTRCSCPAGVGTPSFGAIQPTVTPEASENFRAPVQRLLHGEWSSPVTSNLLLEGVLLHRVERWGNMPPNTDWSSDFVSAAQQSVLESGALIPVLDTSNGRFSHGNFLGYNTAWVPNFYVRSSASYIVKGHQLKAGFSDSFGYLDATSYDYSPYSYFINIAPGLPLTLINEKVTPLRARSDQNYDLGIFLQDRWTQKRVTVNLGVRYDAFKATAPAQVVTGRTPLTPNRADISLPETDLALWQDITPRFGLTYDVRGDGKTAVKVSVNKYLEGQSVGSLVGVLAGGAGPHPVSSLVNSASRLWFDGGPFPGISGAGGVPGDGIPQCDLTNPSANGECGAINNPGFGSTNTNAAQYDRAALFGWGSRAYNWEFGVGVQQQIVPRVSVDVGYFRRIYGGFRVTDNTALAASDFTQFSVVAPNVAGLSDAGQTLTGVFDANRVVQATNLTTLASNYGDQFEHWNGVDVGVTARLQNGVFLFGGLNTGKTMTDNCAVAAKVPESLTVAGLGGPGTSIPVQFCHTETPFVTQVKLNGAYTVPKADVLLSATFQSVQGPRVVANYTITQRAPGVPLVGSGTATVGLIAPGTEYGDRLNELDLRLGKILKFGRTRVLANVDLFNLFNTSAVTTENPNVLAFRTPTGIALARYVKFGAQVDF